jgi:DNA-binding NtrC family response regulator
MPLRVLLVDDDDDLRVEILEYLRRRRHDVTGCSSISDARAAVARQQAESRPPEAVICDVHLIDGNGVDFCLEIAPSLPAARWLLMSGNPDAENLDDKLDELTRRFDFQVVEKPVSLRVLNGILEGKRP